MDIRAFDRVLLARGDPRLLLDARNPVEAARWRPDGPGLNAYLNIPYFEFIEDEDAAFARLPSNSNVLVLCAKGGSSDYVAELLRDRGIGAENIEGGMAAWAAYHRVARINAASDSFALFQIVRPAKGCLSYVVISGGEALVVDCSRHSDAYRQLVDEQGARIVCVMDTHLHADHVSGAAALSAQTGAAYVLADEDAAGATIAHCAVPRSIRIGSAAIDVLTLAVPGHTMGSTALLVDKRYLIGGDTLLPDGIGRPDLGNKAREWAGYLHESLTDVLARLDPALAVLPAHASSYNQFDERGACVRTLGPLLARQPLADRAQFIERTAELSSAAIQPPEYREIRRVNLGAPASPEEIDVLEIGVNKCALASAGA